MLIPNFVSCSTLTKSSFPLKIEKDIKAMKISGFFYSTSEPEIKEILDGSLASFSFTNISSLWSFSWFWLSFIEIEAGLE